MSPKKYIYIVQVTRQLSIDIINNFVNQGMEIRLITGIVESNYEALDPSVKITGLIRHSAASPFRRLFSWTVFTISTFFHILFSGRRNELILVSTPPFIIFLGLFFKKIRDQNYHLIIWDLYPDILVNFGVIKKNSVVNTIWSGLNKGCFNRATSIFTLGKPLAIAISNYTEKKPVIIHNWVNTDFVKPIPREGNPFVEKHNLSGKFVVMYSGNLGESHDLESILTAAEILQANQKIKFVIIGDGAKKERIYNYVAEKNLSNVLLLPYQENTMLPFSLGCADVGVVTLDEGAGSVSVPSKTYYMLSAGSVILAIAPAESELAAIIRDYDCGKIFQKGKTDEIAGFIETLSQNHELADEYKSRSRTASFHFSPENAKMFVNTICKS